ncbi:hypothetical protein WR25_02652 [Diploscapter pachys]|uniref:Uncharacterized protein n=1 Tax=Diploscapter pachys TaxID=2018661 RepID=A0A2A2LIY7_9BILA|nr:hypothetical protein WR25_02652 [Diploscapter pachys]
MSGQLFGDVALFIRSCFCLPALCLPCLPLFALQSAVISQRETFGLQFHSFSSQFLSHVSHLAVHSAIRLVEEMFCNTPPVLHVECAATLCNRSQSIHVLLPCISSNTRNHKSIACKLFAYFKTTFF